MNVFKKMSMSLIVILMILQFGPNTAALAQEKDGAGGAYADKLKRWQALSEEQRRIIRQRAKDIDSQKLNELRERDAEFKAMPQDEQQLIRDNYRKFKELPAEKRESLKQKHQRFRDLPAGKRQELRQRFLERSGRQEKTFLGEEDRPEHKGQFYRDKEFMLQRIEEKRQLKRQQGGKDDQVNLKNGQSQRRVPEYLPQEGFKERMQRSKRNYQDLRPREGAVKERRNYKKEGLDKGHGYERPGERLKQKQERPNKNRGSFRHLK
ncbi:MAG: DUF3106 domain-containing protein [Candidatus Omnitrophica bacterium]|nr:DUF3106 domain-containing protein [Candidatus Omnitrophota bacterium]